MSFDLDFRPKNGAMPSMDELKQYFSSCPDFEVNDLAAGGAEFWFKNKITGVYCVFRYCPDDAEEITDGESSALSFNLNYLRPSFFAFETMPLVESFCKHFDLLVGDLQEDTVEPADAARLIQSWLRHNSNATRAFAQSSVQELNFLSEDLAMKWWRYTGMRERMQLAATDDIFVPSLMLLKRQSNQVQFMTVWTANNTQLFPECDVVFVSRLKKSWFRKVEEKGLISYRSLMERIGTFLDDFEFEGNIYKSLTPARRHHTEPILQSLVLESLDSKPFSVLNSDDFQSVEV